MVDRPAVGEQLLATLELSAASAFSITMSLGLLKTLTEIKKELQRKICRTGQAL